MSKEPATPQEGGEPSSRARGANAAQSQPSGTRRSRHASERQAVQAARHDGAGTSAAMVAHGGDERHLEQPQERASRGEEHPPGHGGAGVTRQPAVGRPKPSYVPVRQKKREQPPSYAPPPSRPVVEQPPVHGPYPHGGVQEERPATPPPGVGGFSIPGEDATTHRKPSLRTKKKETRKTTFGGPVPPVPGEAAPPGGDSLGSPAGEGSLTTAKTIERVSTLPPVADGHDVNPHPQRATPTENGRPSPLFLPERKKKRRPAAFCFTLCCILFWLLVVGIGVAILVVYLLYHPQPPRLRVTTATLNAGYVDQLPPPRGGLALNSDLYVLATIYNPNTKVDVVLRYMQLDLFFHGVMVGTQAVWPPIHEEPGDSALRSVHLVVSEVRMSQEDAEVWHNATSRYGLVELQLRARFHVQLNFGRWLPFRYWVYPSCALWLDPPPGGALRRARCRKSAGHRCFPRTGNMPA